MSIVYSEVSDGAQITFTTSDAGLVTAVHEWFDAQVTDHGDDAIAGHHGATTGASTPEVSTGEAMAGIEDMAEADEFEFLTGMIPHHEQAIATASIIKQRSTRPEMRVSPLEGHGSGRHPSVASACAIDALESPGRSGWSGE